MWTKTDDNRIFLMTENPYTKRHKSSCKSPVILHTEPNTTDGMEAMRTYIAEKFANAIIIEDDDTSVIAEALKTVYFD
jgi:hypothetical protein